MPYANRPSAILFDWDNTLADTWPIIYQSLNRVFEHFDMPLWSFEEVKAGKNGIHQSLRHSFPRLFGERWEEAKQVYYDAFLAVHLQAVKPLEGAKETLEMLKVQDVFVGVVSNKTGKHLRSEVKHLGWEDYFDVVVGALDAEDDKPSPAPIHFALKTANMEAGPKVWMVGDSTTDLEAALAAGALPHFFGDAEFPADYRADARALADIPHWKDHAEFRRQALLPLFG